MKRLGPLPILPSRGVKNTARYIYKHLLDAGGQGVKKVRAKLTREERYDIGRSRLIKVLRTHTVANARTLEQKISDAGPGPMRVDPHILSDAQKDLVKEGRLIREYLANGAWYNLREADEAKVRARLKEQLPIYTKLHSNNVVTRTGQALEIAIYRALLQQEHDFQGQFLNLEEHDDSRLYRKEEPPSHIGRRSLPKQQRLDFLLRHPEVGWAGIEAKNIRPWIYPQAEEVTELLRKCVILDCTPVLIARRISFAASKVLRECGVIIHEVYNQLLPNSEQELAEKVRDKTLLGYHDVRTGNEPDARMIKFITQHLPDLLPEARERFDASKDLIKEYTLEEMPYDEFVRLLFDSPSEDDWLF